MAKTELEIIIENNGDVNLDVKGPKGKKCVEVAELVEKIIGEMKIKQYKPDYYEQDVVIKTEIDTEIK